MLAAMSERNPWRTLSSRVVYANPWMRVREDQVIRPDGEEGIYGVVEPTRVATGVVPLTADGRVHLVGQYRYATAGYSWEIPEGGADPGEEPEAAARRELREEAGLVAAEWSVLAGPVHLSNCFTAEVAWVYLARDLSPVPPDPEGTEVLAREVVPLAAALERVAAGAITDAVTVIGLLRAREWLAGRS